MVSLRFSLLCLAACLSPRVQAFGVLHSRGLVVSRSTPRSLPTREGYSTLVQRRAMNMQVNPREDGDFEMTVDWDEELRKLNASQYGKSQERDLTKDINDPEVVKWARSNAKKAQEVAKDTSYQVRGAMKKAPRWQQLSRDYRFWLGLVVGISLLASILSAASHSSQDLVVLNDAFGAGSDGLGGVFAYAALMAASTAHAAGDAATQLADTGATFVLA